MMSRAAYMMQDHIRRSYAYITDVALPSVFLCRGRLAFPQGLTAISIWFHRWTAADLYAHPYFIEKQSNPDQPSPQMHTTEELQGIIKVMQGLQYMRDDLSKLDNTLCVMTDYNVQVEGRMLCFETLQPSVKQEQQKEEEEKTTRASMSTPTESEIAHQQVKPKRILPRPNIDSYRTASAVQLSTEKLHEAPAKPSRVRFPRPQRDDPLLRRLTRLLRGRLSCASGSFEHHPPRLLSAPAAAAKAKNQTTGKEIILLSIKMRIQTTTTVVPTVEVRWRACKGAYTVLYNPCEVNERTFMELLLRLRREDRVVAALVIPTRQTWREVQLWADAFPDAKILSSAAIPLHTTADENLRRNETISHGNHNDNDVGVARGAYQDLGNGVMGLVLPDLEPEEVEAEKERSVNYPNHPPLKRAKLSPPPLVTQPNLRPRQAEEGEGEEVEETRQALRASCSPVRRAKEFHRERTKPDVSSGFTHGEDPADAIWDPTAAARFHAADAPGAGLRRSDAGRVEILLSNASPISFSSPTITSTPTANEVAVGPATSNTSRSLTADLELLLVPGDTIAQEFVLYHHATGVLACVELFHGTYSDFDGVNSWLCRVWFKFMRRGNHKDERRVPRFKWRQVVQTGGLGRLQTWLDRFTRTHPIRAIVSAHGTPPLTEDAANVLRRQWNLAPLAPSQLPRRLGKGRRSGPF